MKALTAVFQTPEGTTMELAQALEMIHAAKTGMMKVTAKARAEGAELAEVRMTATGVELIFA
jgi:hypothetical protein